MFYIFIMCNLIFDRLVEFSIKLLTREIFLTWYFEHFQLFFKSLIFN